MRKHFLFLVAATTLLIAACNSSKKAMQSDKNDVANLTEVVLDDVQVTASANKGDANEDQEIGVYRASEERKNDLLHTKLDLRFDWSKQRVLGKATLTFKPYFYATDLLKLDAKNFDFNSVTIDGKSTALKYEYDNKEIIIHLDRTYTRNEEYKIAIDYVAKPEERTNIGGSAAINSDKGLYFINPKGEDKEKPMQIWSQGETQSNSCWFPTIDSPNERATDEITMTVEDKYKTLSNGLLISSKKNTDGTRTDYWKMDQPHAPYLVMIAVGDYAIVKDKWENIEVNYYVEKEFEQDAKAIFPHTTEMLTFFSNKLGVKYPWQKYSQIVCRDYVSGAMENTTAVIFGEFMQGHERELIDVQTNELVTAHEMFHHWFGDYVTTESWSNLTLNEGFANYSEYLWLEHKYGRDAADQHWLTELQGYFGQAKNKRHALIDFVYNDREEMFDAHSYNKGGLVLHMLRNYLGDDAFFTALGDYLRSHAYTAVEVHDLRMAFEKTSGKDLNWFFNQWYLTPGHPEVIITKNYDAVTSKLSVTIDQKQGPVGNKAVYELPIAIDVYTAIGEKQRFEVSARKRKETFVFDVKKQPKLVNVDAKRVTLWEASYEKTKEELAFQFANAPLFMDRQEAIIGLGNADVEATETKNTFEMALKDNEAGIRESATNMADINKAEVATQLEKMAVNDPNSQVRGSALARLAQTNDKKYVTMLKQVLGKERAYPVIAEAINSLYGLDKTEALAYLPTLENEENSSISSALADIYAENPKVEYLSFFEKRMSKIVGYDAISFMGAFGKLSMGLDDTNQAKAVEKLKGFGLDQATSPWRRFGAVKALTEIRNTYKQLGNAEKTKELVQIITDIKAKETNPQLKAAYESADK
jgi:aminopeptidase N